jgi:hypothetical protein
LLSFDYWAKSLSIIGIKHSQRSVQKMRQFGIREVGYTVEDRYQMDEVENIGSRG